MYTQILHATDLSESHFNMCQQAAKIAEHFHAKLYLLHVIEPPATLQIAQGLGFAEFYKPLKDDAETVMRVIGEALNIPPAHQLIEIGSATQHILQKVEEFALSLLIIGSHTPTNLPSFLGNTAQAVVHQASCDVLTLRAK